MKRILLLASTIFSLTAMTAQCTADYDFGEAAFGVSPDPEMGETFDVGTVDVAYQDDIHILVPDDASDIDETLPALGIDSLQLLSVELVLDGMTFTPEEVGLTVNCNNNGDSGNPCSFLPLNQYCARLEGTPSMAGTFQLVINVEGWFNIGFGPQSQDVAFDQYTLIINSDVAVNELTALSIDLGQNVPNPASNFTMVPFNTNTAGTVELSVINLLGEVLINELVDAKRGDNNVKIDVSNLDNGIYLYSLESNGKKLTKRMIINR